MYFWGSSNARFLFRLFIKSCFKQDRAEGYMMQNQLLNTETAELSQLRQEDERKMNEYQHKVFANR